MNKVKHIPRKPSFAKFSVIYVVVWGNTLYGYATNMKQLHKIISRIKPISYNWLTVQIKENDGKVEWHGYKIYRIRP